MKLSFPTLKKSSGFTLIELLVVIAIIGILAAALIATIDPLEQIRKGQDTTMKTTAVEYLNALTRYYGTNQQFPWNITGAAGAPCNTLPSGGGTATALNNNIFAAATTGCTALLITSGELKGSFLSVQPQTLLQLQAYMTGTAPNQTITVCYSPTSKSGMRDVNTIHSAIGGGTPGSPFNAAGGLCPNGVAGQCYWCAQ